MEAEKNVKPSIIINMVRKLLLAVLGTAFSA